MGLKMKHKACFHIAVLFTLAVFTGCIPISAQWRNKAAPLSFADVFKNPEAYQGKIVIWGGEIIQTTNQKDGTSLMEVVQRPLDWQEEPERAESPGGRFFVLVKRFLDPHTYRQGREVTVAGEIIGQKTEVIDKTERRYPLLLAEQVYLWRLYGFYYPYSYYSPYYPFGSWGYYGPSYNYPDPWWNYPDPWWNYPDQWGNY